MTWAQRTNRVFLLLAVAVLLLSLTGLFRISLALSGHLADKPGLTTRITLVLMQEKLVGPGEPAPRLQPTFDTSVPLRLPLPSAERVWDLTEPTEAVSQPGTFVSCFATVLFRSSSNFV